MKRKTPRLGYSEYVIPDPKSSSAVWIARLELMEAVQRVYPTMLRRLSADVFPAYEALAESGFDFDAILWNSRLSPFIELGAVDLDLVEHRLVTRVAEPATRKAGGARVPSDERIAKAARDGDFETFERLMKEEQLAAYRRRRFLAGRGRLRNSFQVHGSRGYCGLHYGLRLLAISASPPINRAE